MVKKHFCDRCGKDLGIRQDAFDEVFEKISSAFEEEDEDQITQPQLCRKCMKGYEKIIKETNKKIEDYCAEIKTNSKDF